VASKISLEERRIGSAETATPLRAVSPRAVLALGATAIVMLPIAWSAMFNSYAFYEDEGYLLVTLREWARHGGLYTRDFSRYGPAEMFFFGLPERLLGAQFTFTSGRVVTLALWLATSMVLGLTVLVMGRHTMTAVLTQVVSFFLLQSFANEPMHPGQLVALVMALMVLVMAAVRPRRPSLGDGLLGILMGTLLMTEVNLGVFALVAFAYVFSTKTTLAARPILRILSELALVALGPVLIVSSPAATTAGSISWWAIKYALVYAAAALLVVLFSRLQRVEPIPSFDGRAIIRFTSWFVGSLVFFGGFTLVTGTRIRDLVDGVFLAPLGQSKSLIAIATINSAAVLWLIAPVAVLVGFRWIKRQSDPARSPIGSAQRLLGAGIRVVAGIVAIVAISRNTNSALAFIPLAAVCLFPPLAVQLTSSSMNARRFLVAFAVTESLHAFPVAGSQVSWSLMLIVPCAALTLEDGCREFLEWRGLQVSPGLGIATVVFLAALIIVPWPNSYAGLFGSYFHSARNIIDTYRTNKPLDLPGASGLRLPAEQVKELRSISAALRRTCSQFVSVPGYDGLYVLTGIAPPNGINATVWMYLFTHSEQQSVVNVLKTTRGPVCLVERSGLAIDVTSPSGIPPLVGPSINWRTWAWAQPIPAGPLVHYLSTGFVPRVKLPPYLILVRES
jgi:hypothetical protein